MLLSDKMNQLLNEQIVNEMFASQTYLAMAAMFRREGLTLLAKRFREQTEEEREHALKLLDYVEDRLGTVQLGAIPEPRREYKSVVEAIDAALEHEKMVSKQIDNLVEQARKDNDNATESFLGWFVDEQVEEVRSMYTLAQVARASGPALLQVEAYMAHLGKS